ncbi:type II toxin-antitoxin system VapC family toxin [Janibacter alkaliphilus]|uniref:Ribonuclease VapC n=1 Tax=Janibacter alkaliphilus TaxID=1069963 RepID=A0A852X0Z0_9MICO|nr:putative nucleic acid-binding protein [Janibacter alkaliphilus]
MLYVDSSALLKRVFAEAESDGVRDVIAQRQAAGEVVVASELAWVEVSRALRRAQVDDADRYVELACSGIARHPLDGAVLERARRVGPPQIRTLDAIHLAAAVALGADEILTFDHRLAEAARSLGVRAIP